MIDRFLSGLLLFMCGYSFGVGVMSGKLWPLVFSALVGVYKLMLVIYDISSKRAAPEEKKS